MQVAQEAEDAADGEAEEHERLLRERHHRASAAGRTCERDKTHLWVGPVVRAEDDGHALQQQEQDAPEEAVRGQTMRQW